MTAPAHVFADCEALAASVAEEITSEIAAAARDGRRYVIGCPSGRTPEPVYTALADRIAGHQVGLGHVTVIMVDEYAEPDADRGFRPIPDDLPHSCTRFGRQRIVDRLNAVAPEPIPADRLWVPDPADPHGFESQVDAAGGLDLVLLASGASDGHVAFNPAGTDRDAGTRVVALDEATRRDNLGTFPTFTGLDEVPRYGVTLGPADLRRAASAIMIVTGAHKARALHEITRATGYTLDWPATIIHECRRPRILADRSAAEPVTTAHG